MKITEDQFIKRFKPDLDADGNLFQYGAMVPYILERAERERRLWTMIEEDGELALLQGYHFVNVLYFIICDKPYPKGKKIEVMLD